MAKERGEKKEKEEEEELHSLHLKREESHGQTHCQTRCLSVWVVTRRGEERQSLNRSARVGALWH